MVTVFSEDSSDHLLSLPIFIDDVRKYREFIGEGLTPPVSADRQAQLIFAQADYFKEESWQEIKAAGLVGTMLRLQFEDVRGRLGVRGYPNAELPSSKTTQ